MSEPSNQTPPLAPPVSAFTGPVAELIAQRMLTPPSRPGMLAGLDHFEILRVLGGGGMGIVLLARDAQTGRDVAIKLVKTDLVANQHVVHRFLKEAGHLKRLRHTNIVPVQEISDRPEGPFFVMPLFEKGSLANRIKIGQPLDTETILAIATQVAEGLSFAHRSGIIHRDLKPANILLGANGQVCLADFGLARTVFNDTIVDVESRQMEGTAPYMSPAVAAGDAEDTRCDIYSFGALLYEMLTGHPPYKGRGTKEILDQILAGPPKPITSLNPAADRGLVAVAEKAMARELRDRYADMRDILEDLQLIKEGKEPGASPHARGFSRVAKMALVPVCLAGAILLAWAFFRNPNLNPNPNPSLNPSPNPAPNTVAKPLPAPTTTVLAGQVGSIGFADGMGSQAEFRSPNNVALDADGYVYVADTANDVIRKITPQGMVSTLAGVAGSSGNADGVGANARLWAPFGIAVDTGGNVYVADTANDTIRKITPAGVVSTLAGLAGHPGSNDGIGSAARFRNPWSVAVDRQGNVFVADLSNDTIRKITPDGVVITYDGLAGLSGYADGFGSNARFNNPAAVAVDSQGNVYVSDTGNDVIRKILPNRVVVPFAGSPGKAGSADGAGSTSSFDRPQGLALDNVGDVYVADAGNDSIRKITALGVVTTLPPGEINGGTVQLNSPSGIAVDLAGNLFVADTGDHCIRKISGVSNR